jgi:hypothetical protein
LVIFGLFAVVLYTDAAAQARNAFGHELLDEATEVELALSAAPVPVARGASVWVLRSNGFERVREGTNGFHCLIQRANDVKIVAPTCFDAEASRTIMAAQLYQADLWSEGKSAEQVNTAVAAAYRNGTLRPPMRGAVGYMMSSAQFLGDGIGNWYPHMMIYAPYVNEEDVGANLTDPKNPVHMLNPGRPDARIVVVVPEFVNPGELVGSNPTGR